MAFILIWSLILDNRSSLARKLLLFLFVLVVVSVVFGRLGSAPSRHGFWLVVLGLEAFDLDSSIFIISTLAFFLLSRSRVECFAFFRFRDQFCRTGESQ